MNETVPEFLRIAGDPIRWRLLLELSKSDRQVDELVTATGQRQNLVSYHLGQLRSAGLLTTHRSDRDARHVYYSLALDRAEELLQQTAEELHPVLSGFGTAGRRAGTAFSSVLFLCTENSARSQMAEALLRAQCSETVTVASAGSRPTRVHPGAIAAMRRRGVDISDQRSKDVGELAGRHFDLVISVCDNVREAAQKLGDVSERRHWSVADPVSARGRSPGAFDDAADDLARRVRYLRPLVAG